MSILIFGDFDQFWQVIGEHPVGIACEPLAFFHELEAERKAKNPCDQNGARGFEAVGAGLFSEQGCKLLRVSALIRGDSGEQVAVVLHRLTLGQVVVDDGLGQFIAKLRTQNSALCVRENVCHMAKCSADHRGSPVEL